MLMQKREGMPWVVLPLGVKFQPTDEELISGHLLPRYRGEKLPFEFITFSEDVYEKPPSEFCTDSTAFFGQDNKEKHYFFTDLNRAKEHADRKVGSFGYWHESKKWILRNNNNKIIGYKKLLNFILKGEDKKNTEWLMHEFSPCLNEGELNNLGEVKNLVLCVIQNKKKEKGTGSCLVLDLDSGSVSDSGRLEIARVKSYSVDSGSPMSCFDHLDLVDAISTDPQFDKETAEAERGTGGLEEDIAAALNRVLAVETVPQFDQGTGGRWMQELTDSQFCLSPFLSDSTTTANGNPCPAQDEETQQSKKMRYNQRDNELVSACSDLIHAYSTFSTN